MTTKKTIALGLLIVAGLIFARQLPVFQPNLVAGKPDEEPAPVVEINDGSDIDQLQQLACSCEAIRWSLEIEDGNPDGSIYEKPILQHFHFCYEQCTQVHSIQERENYLEWIETFYEGNLMAKGWNATTEKVLKREDNPETRRYLNVLGRVLASEWSKHKKVQKIKTRDIIRWARALKAQKLTLNDIASEVSVKLDPK